MKRSTSGPSDSSKKNSQTFATISTYVTTGELRTGIESRSGIMRASASLSAPSDDRVGRASPAVDEQDQIPTARLLDRPGEFLRRSHWPPVHFLNEVPWAQSGFCREPTRQHAGDDDARLACRQIQPPRHLGRHIDDREAQGIGPPRCRGRGRGTLWQVTDLELHRLLLARPEDRQLHAGPGGGAGDEVAEVAGVLHRLRPRRDDPR